MNIKNILIGLLLALPVIVLAEDSVLTASITSPADNVSFEIDQSIDFATTISGGTAPYTFVWSFGDGTPDTAGQSVTKSFASAGQKTISLVVTDIADLRVVDSVTININAPVVNLDATINSPTATIFEVGQNIDFAVSVSGGTAPYTYVWNFGDGTPDTAGQSVSHSYSQAGSKAVSVRVSDLNDAQKILNLNLTINTVSSAFDASITSPANNSSFDINESINFVGSATGGTAPYTFVWNFGDSTPNTAGQTVSHSYASAGSKTATLTVTDFVGATKTATVTVSINTAGGGGGGGSTKPVISNIRVTDVTETTAIVRWTTDRNANSRVIYDTTSHPSISSASFPNFGYAHSSVSQDDSTKVTEHAVTITGLTANTTYYYRVLSQ